MDKSWKKDAKRRVADVVEDIIKMTSKEEIITDDTNEKVETTSIEKVIQTIKELDSGDGADIEEVKKGSDVTNSEEVLDMLLKRGDLFTIRPGRVKILE